MQLEICKRFCILDVHLPPSTTVTIHHLLLLIRPQIHSARLFNQQLIVFRPRREIFEYQESDDEEEKEKDLELCQSEKLEDGVDGGGQRPPFPAFAHVPTRSHSLRHLFFSFPNTHGFTF